MWYSLGPTDADFRFRSEVHGCSECQRFTGATDSDTDEWRCTVKLASRLPRAIVVLSCWAMALIFMGYAARTASAQVLYGSIVGTLTDETGAVIPKAAVTVTNRAT